MIKEIRNIKKRKRKKKINKKTLNYIRFTFSFLFI
jgi:hypothetical protein